jgi:hypothetical protein
MPTAVATNHGQDIGETSAARSVPTETEMSDMVKDQGLVTRMYLPRCFINFFPFEILLPCEAFPERYDGFAKMNLQGEKVY